MKAVLRDVLRDFESVRGEIKSQHFRPYNVGLGMHMMVSPVPDNVVAELHKATERAVGVNLKSIATFCRLNAVNINNEFRIHVDSIINGYKPKWATVFYLDTRDDAGTAFFTHPEHGMSSEENSIHVKDDGKWEAYARFYQEANSMIVYRSNLYHGRFPWKAFGKDQQDGRIVIVNFLIEV